ncbi:hypothetical protein BDK92_7288 [Micromonospora pisi]|uniref:Uncharacterized protein n=1 Tax=Micromonospora pisi TaxID=589240 RepID=A0A495JUX3_9ACTN|nr:hypothetical protein [Micromonospora pisi]RKR92806.1 hypothetical protein BDK92_7288 [Micromonospora pisi]
MSDTLDQIDAAINNLCACGCGRPLSPDGESAYFRSANCQARWHNAQAHNPREVYTSEDPDYQYPDGPARWRPDLVTAADDTGLTPLGSQTWYTGRFQAQIFEHDGTDAWHLRLNDGHRYVGTDLADVGGRQDPVTDELVTRIGEVWRRLERELTNRDHTVADDRLPLTSLDLSNLFPGMSLVASQAIWVPAPVLVEGYPWRRLCMSCNRHGAPQYGLRLGTELRVRVEAAQECPHCGTEYPGPVLRPAAEREPEWDSWRLSLTATNNGHRYGHRQLLSMRHLTAVVDPAALIQYEWDRMELELLRQIPGAEPQPRPPARVWRETSTGRVWVGPVDGDVTDPTRYTELGHVAEDGLRFNEPEPPPGFHSMSVVRARQIRFERQALPAPDMSSLRVSLAELGRRVHEAILGGMAPLVPVAEQLRAAMDRFHTGQQAEPTRFEGGLTDDQRRALGARRNRNTGPPPAPLDSRRRGHR